MDKNKYMHEFSTSIIGSPIATSSPSKISQNNFQIYFSDWVKHATQTLEEHNKIRLNTIKHIKKLAAEILQPVADVVFCDADHIYLPPLTLKDVIKNLIVNSRDSGITKSENDSRNSSRYSSKNSIGFLKSNKCSRRVSSNIGTLKIENRKSNLHVKKQSKKKQNSKSKSKNSKTVNNVMCTPMQKIPYNNLAVVTPGPNINTPSRVFRKPNDGEPVISLGGSPILASTTSLCSKVPQMHIPLKDGRVYAVMAEEGLENSEFPDVDEETLNRIKRLHEFIGDQILGIQKH
ncbi:uncharacterized protein LOC106665239 [Cimex lectularius]|uniref:Borealin C-terminal domain-containing protein n=1 Tax=Cimex lectularius TaxID=79782 RepID=A0A8I6RL69_CIMLE|nr:uncharacterized protein LOC106665239 [Cimex lectularius]XP_014247004.1 uncharacterized protein LOC106665239 [Cimex lectularius]XP_014247005.1 uncharacterized protein LOC106665239 [Cimex lectularius]XP_014247006.1 uncharacterized protein LOC106665239 [Cimex lectularius]XP_014247007.1 uncharacterized protein LOC106665239 [Cimex lectularius]